MDSKHSAAIGLVSGLGMLAVSLVVPSLFPNLERTTQLCILVVGLAFMALSLVGYARPHLFSEGSVTNSAGTGVETGVAGPQLTIIVGHDGPYVNTQSYNVYNVMKTVLVGVKNSGGKYLTNCKVDFEMRNGEGTTPERWRRTLETFSLNPGEVKYLEVASFNEPVPPHPPSGLVIQLSAPPSGTFWRPPSLPKQGGTVVVIASCAETAPCEMMLRLWVKDERLRWEKV